MISCPSCQQPVEILDKHMGTLFTCPHCSAVYFIDWSGQPEMAQHEAEPEYNSEPSNEFQNFETGYEAPTSYEAHVTDESFGSSQDQGQQTEEPSADFGSETPEETPYDFSQTLDAPTPVMPVSTSDTPDFSDVVDFANSNTSDGPLSYTVVIEGVDSSRLLAQLKEAMTDSRFGWDVESVLTNLGSGHIVLKGLTPAKASVLINRIKYLPFKITWRQDVLSGS